MRLTGGASAGVEDRIRADTAFEQAFTSRAWKAQSNLAILLTQGFARKLASHFRTDDITTISDARPQMDVDMGGFELGGAAKPKERRFDDARGHASPAGVRRRHGMLGREQNGKAIGRGNCENDPWGSSPETVTGGLETRSHHLHRASPVHLGRHGQRIGIEAERGQQTATVLRDGFGPIGGRTAEVQGVMGGDADSAAAGREGEAGLTGLGLVETPSGDG